MYNQYNQLVAPTCTTNREGTSPLHFILCTTMLNKESEREIKLAFT